MDRYLYHCFPRRGACTPAEIDKGCEVLASIRDFGLLLAPEAIEWKQPSADGTARTFPVLQTRVCFTDLSPSELPQHAKKFGHFALEFEFETARCLGAIPVFYVPQPISNPADGNAVGVALVAIANDARAIIDRIARLSAVLNGPIPTAARMSFDVGFARSPADRAVFNINSSEARMLLAALGHNATPLLALGAGAAALLNFFYPADDTPRDRLLEYYRQREWRIACGFAINGKEVLHVPTPQEAEAFLRIDREFFSRQIPTDTGNRDTLTTALVHPGLTAKRVVEMVRRFIVPAAAVARVAELLSAIKNHGEIIAIENV
jgi:hypothetical protein